MKTLLQILGAANLCGVIQGIKSDLGQEILPPKFRRVTRTVEGNKATYRKVEGTRRLARLVHYGAPSKTRNVSGVSEIPVALLHSFENMHHEPSVLMNLTNMADDGRQKLGIAEITRQTVEFNQLFENLRFISGCSALFTGYVHVGHDGDLLPSSSGAAYSIDYGIPSGNRNQLNVLGAGNIIANKWSTVSTNIHTHIKNLKTAARKLTGYKVTHAFYGNNIFDYLLKNTALKEIINRKTSLQDSFIAGEIADGFLGIKKWIPASEVYFVDADGEYQQLVGDNDIVFTPDPSPEWWEVIEGTYPIPTSIGALTPDAIAAMSGIKAAAGKFSYAQVLSDPTTIKHLAGDTFLPIIKVPGSVFIGTVHW